MLCRNAIFFERGSGSLLALMLEVCEHSAYDSEGKWALFDIYSQERRQREKAASAVVTMTFMKIHPGTDTNSVSEV